MNAYIQYVIQKSVSKQTFPAFKKKTLITHLFCAHMFSIDLY